MSSSSPTVNIPPPLRPSTSPASPAAPAVPEAPVRPDEIVYNNASSTMSRPDEPASNAARIPQTTTGTTTSPTITTTVPALSASGNAPPATWPAGHATVPSSASIASTTTNSSSHPPLRPLLNISFIDLLEADPRPAFVVSLTSPTPSVVYCNPALTNSPTLRDVIERPSHAAIWDGIAATTNAKPDVGGGRGAEPLAAVEHLGLSWTRTVLGGSQYAVISANQPAPAEEASAARAAPTVLIKPSEPSVLPLLETPPATTTKEPVIQKPTSPQLLQQQQQHHPEPLTPPTSAVFSPPEDDAGREREPSLAATQRTENTKISFDSDIPEQSLAVVGSSSSSSSSKSKTEYLHQFEAITDFMPVGMCVFDPAGSVSFANHAWYHIMGCPPAAVVVPGGIVMTRTTFLSHIEDEDQEAVLRFFEQAANVPNSTFGFRVKKYDPQNSATEAAAGASASLSVPSASPNSSPPAGLDNTPKKAASQLSAPSSRTATPAPVVLADAQESHVLATACSEIDAQGRLVRVLVCLRDITEHQHIAEAADRHAQQARNLRRMAEFATVGMYDMDIDGRLRGANRVFYEMCGLEREADDADLSREIIRPWLKCVHDEDQPLVQACLDSLVAGGGRDHQTVELRFKKPWTTDDGAGGRIVAPRWVEASFLPVKDSDGKVQSVTGCLSDISLRRWQLERERQVKEEAIESKRQQENFVDITSHEIRNPLTVIMHCGDAVLEGLTRLRDGLTGAAAGVGDLDRARAMLEDGIDYAEIIVSSALHQKAIVDDILTMSKLDSDLLAVTPVTVDPIEIVRSTLKMFDVQARQQHIQLRMAVAPSYRRTLVASPFLVLDPSRVKQILINLLTNAIKFTQAVAVREVTTTISVAHARPTDAMCAVSFVPQPADNKLAPAYAASSKLLSSLPPPLSPSSPSSASPSLFPASPALPESVFLVFEVRDTGEGLTKEGMDSLFQKFVQADSNTHVKHGGSGLGLFISKRLAEIQNGAIGVASEPGIGSTFVFYIEAYIPPPSAVPEVLSPSEAAKIALAAGLSSVSRATGGQAPPVTSSGSNSSSNSILQDLTSDSYSAYDSRAKPSQGQQTNNGKSSASGEPGLAASQAATPPVAADGTPAASAPDAPTTTTLAKAAAPSSPAGRPQRAAGGGGRLASVPATPPEIRGVLLVEDNIVNQKVTRRYFEKCGFHVEVAANGVEAMDKIQASDRRVAGSYAISVVLMDMEMPVQDGLTCTRHIRALEAAGAFAGGRMPVLMITGNARPEQIAEARAAGCDDVIIKPFQMHLLFEHIKLVMQALWEDDVRALGGGGGDDIGDVGVREEGDRGDKENGAASSTPDDKKRDEGDTASEPLDEGVVLPRQRKIED